MSLRCPALRHASEMWKFSHLLHPPHRILRVGSGRQNAPTRRLNKVERNLESVVQIGNLSSRKRPNVIRKFGLAKAHKVVTHNPA